MPILKKLLPAFFSSALFAAVVFFIEPPKTWPNATIFQILAFFLPLLASLTFIINIYFAFLPHSFSIALGLMFLLTLKTTGNLNITTGTLTMICMIAIFSIVKKIRTRHPKSLTFKHKTPTLSPIKKFKP